MQCVALKGGLYNELHVCGFAVEESWLYFTGMTTRRLDRGWNRAFWTFFLYGLHGFILAQALETFPGTGHSSEFTIPIEVSAVSETPPSITFKFWRAGQYDIYRKDPAATAWGALHAQTGSGAQTWTDTAVALGTEYEYRFVLKSPNPPPPQLMLGGGSGDLHNYLRAGVRVDRTGPRGRMVLLVAEDAKHHLAAEVARYKQDLVGDGWIVHEIVTPRGLNNNQGHGFDGGMGAEVYQGIRSQIQTLYAAHGNELKHVMILGRVPMPRSGLHRNWRFDGHGTYGAHGCDAYYSEMNNDEVWTDTGSNAAWGYENPFLNVPGDGKWDLMRVPDDDPAFLELGTSRVDMGLVRDEFPKLKMFLDKLHRYKHAHPDFRPGRRFAFRGNGFDNPGETWWQAGAAISGLANMDLVDPAEVTGHSTLEGDAAWTVENGPYLFYSKGNGSPGISIGARAVMWTGMQSNFGLWYRYPAMPDRLGEDSLILSWTYSVWGFRWHYHPLGLGDVMGEVTRISVNNRGIGNVDGLYRFDSNYVPNGDWTGFFMFQHIGDAAMRLFMFPPPARLVVNPTTEGALLSWEASEDVDVLGYHVYRAADAMGPFTRLTADPLAATDYTDAATTAGTWTYMVRAVKLEATGSGTFLNGSQGIFRTVSWDAPDPLTLDTDTLPDAYIQTQYETALAASGGIAPYTWTVDTGALPAGLSLAVDGTLSGTPDAAGESAFTVMATDVQGQEVTRALTLTVQQAQPHEIPILADALAQSWNDNYNGGATEIYFNRPDNRGYFLKYDLSTLPTGTVHKAVLRVVLLNPSTSSGTLTFELTEDAHDVWGESTGGGTHTDTSPDAYLTRNNRPPVNEAAPKGTYTGDIPNGLPIDIDVTALVAYDLQHDPHRILGLTATFSGLTYIGTKEHPQAAVIAPRLKVYVDESGLAPSAHTLTYTAGPGGYIAGPASQTVEHGGSGAEVTAVASNGYRFVAWSDAVTTASRTDPNITASLAVSASFQAEGMVDFNSGWEDLEANRWSPFAYAGSPVGFGRVSAGGLNGTDALQPGRNAALVYPEPFSSTLASWQTGVFMRYQTPASTGNAQYMLVLGAVGGTALAEGENLNITTVHTGMAGGGGNLYGFRAALVTDSNPAANIGVVRFRLFNVNDGNTGGTSVWGSFTDAADDNLLQTGQWYFVGMNVTFNEEDDTYDITAELRNATSRGEVGEVVLLSTALTGQSNAAFLANDTGVYNFISGGDFGTSGNAAMDNLLLATSAPARTPYEEWVYAAGAMENTAPLEDASGDGVPNLLAYGLGYALTNTVPRSAMPAIRRMPPTGEESNAIYIDYRRNLLATDLIYTVAHADEVGGPWLPVVPDGMTITDTLHEQLDAHIELRRLRVPVPPEPHHRFFRLQIELE